MASAEATRTTLHRVWEIAQIILGSLLLISFLTVVAASLLLAGADRWSTLAPDDDHPYAVHLRGTAWRYFGPITGRVIAWSFPGLAASCGLLVVGRWLDRRLERRSRTRPGWPP